MILHMGFTNEELLHILIFYGIGAILGFFSFRFSYKKSKLENAINCCITTGLGVFLAYIFANYLKEHNIFSTEMSMLIGGLGSFGLPDMVIKYWPKLGEKLANLVMFRIDRKAQIEEPSTKDTLKESEEEPINDRREGKP